VLHRVADNELFKGKPWAIRRLLFHKSLKAPTIQLYKPRQEAEASLLAFDILQDGGKKWVKVVDRYTASVILTTGYGRRIESMDAKVIQQKLGYLQFGGGLIAPGRFWAETLPWLKHVPNFLAPWKKAIERKGDEEAAFSMSLVELVRSDLKISSASEPPKPKERISSFTEQILEMQETKEMSHLILDERSLAALPGSFFTAGFDTTASTIGTCLLALILHPQVLYRAQAELDKVLPCISSAFTSARSPTFADKSRLPYVYALVLESLRWRPATPLGIAHASSAPSKYQGFIIPAGTTVIASAWSQSHNATFYPFPSKFNPARFLPPGHHLYDPKLVGQKHPLQSGLSSFGWGRRACPGEQLAINTIFIGVARLLWGFEITGMKGENVDTMDYKGGSLVRPPRFGVEFTVRSPSHRLVIEREAKEARAFMKAFEKID
jgi:cytochrome P450